MLAPQSQAHGVHEAAAVSGRLDGQSSRLCLSHLRAELRIKDMGRKGGERGLRPALYIFDATSVETSETRNSWFRTIVMRILGE